MFDVRREISVSWEGKEGNAEEEDRLVAMFSVFMRRMAYLVTGRDLRFTIDGKDRTPRDWKGE